MKAKIFIKVAQNTDYQPPAIGSTVNFNNIDYNVAKIWEGRVNLTHKHEINIFGLPLADLEPTAPCKKINNPIENIFPRLFDSLVRKSSGFKSISADLSNTHKDEYAKRNKIEPHVAREILDESWETIKAQYEAKHNGSVKDGVYADLVKNWKQENQLGTPPKHEDEELEKADEELEENPEGMTLTPALEKE